MLKIEGKTFMNIQEAVQWLLENNALPYQCTANYAPLTEIGLGTIVNPSPAKVRIGSLIFFADSKVSTVVGITENGFICSDQYNNLVDDVAYVTNVTINASGHLITTMSDGQTIDAGLIKQVSSFSINASQHLIITYNNGTSEDLGAIFNGNVNIAGNFTADSIIENMSGYSFSKASDDASNTFSYVYAGVVKNGNKLTFAVAVNVTKLASAETSIGYFNIPAEIGNKLYPTSIGGNILLSRGTIGVYQSDGTLKSCECYVYKASATQIYFVFYNTNIDTNATGYVRMEATFLLSENLAS